MNRDEMLERLAGRSEPWDIVVIGGGATGLGIAVDAASRGYATVLVEQADFGQGTSSRSTKLIHGGVRYLRQGNISLVRDSLRERERLRTNAPHIVRALPFLIPTRSWLEGAWYAAGLKTYDLMAGRDSFPTSRWLTASAAAERVPTVRTDQLRGGVLYWDGQFDDARLLVTLARTAANHGAVLLNYMTAVSFERNTSGKIDGVSLLDAETGESHDVATRTVINATGPLVDGIRRLDDQQSTPLITPSQGAHLVLDPSFLPAGCALMIPKTRDGRVMFAIPWKGRTLVGTTDELLPEPSMEPVASEQEIDFLLETAGEYFSIAPQRSDIKAVFAGIRPLVRSGAGKPTSSISRDHTIEISSAGLVTICGGKWTTYRKMAEDCVCQAARIGGLDTRPCQTVTLRVHGYAEATEADDWLGVYGSDALRIEALAAEHPEWNEQLDEALPIRAAEIVWAARHEMARTVEDVLSRRTRALALDARACRRMAPQVARLMARELGREPAWIESQVSALDRLV